MKKKQRIVALVVPALSAFGNFALLSGPLFFKSRYVWIKMAQTRTRYPNDILISPFPDVLRLIVPGLC
ncbi:hypothetical protein [Cohnella laeviribosi]|uniref:hypothetical protein n=1 Tax=Cohnella laeviribosi TaxID=380174 RepID=UPI00036F6FAB|nr:hypothetical protein [Cohnella laeviribosi]